MNNEGHDMRSFDYIATGQRLLTPRTVALLTAIQEAKGRQSVRAAIRPDVLETLENVARIQSTDASNRIEGISTSGKRLTALMQAKVTPRNRNEEEIAGYRDVLATIHESHDWIPLTPNVILQLHRDLFRHTPFSFAGRFKDSDNIIVERDATGNQRTRFAPPPAIATPGLMERSCAAHAEALRGEQANPLLAMTMLILDFTCIHPFNDGNGRMSRLLTLLLMYRSGHDVGKYISIEHLIEQSKETYYEALAASTIGWDEGVNDYEPFTDYMLGIILAAYRELDERMRELTAPASPRDVQRDGVGRARPWDGAATKERRVAAVFERSLNPLSKADLHDMLPDVSVTTIERALKKLLDDGRIMKIGAGRGTRYVAKR